MVWEVQSSNFWDRVARVDQVNRVNRPNTIHTSKEVWHTKKINESGGAVLNIINRQQHLCVLLLEYGPWFLR